MKIIAHRGLWTKREEGNTMEGFQKAFVHGYGIETDIRDFNGILVVSHNVAADTAFPFADVLRLYSDMNCNTELAINIKADGLQILLRKELERYHIANYFVFDMSIPEQVVFHREGFQVFTRMSEWETVPVLLEKSQGIWMDEWETSWIQADVIRSYRKQDKLTAIISPEIHGRDKSSLWRELRQFNKDQGVLLCTDVPMEAEEYFHE